MKMTPRKRKNKLNQKTLESLREPGMYFFNDAPAIAVKVTKNQRKSFYASYSIPKGVDSEGRIRSTGRYKFICRLGEKPISVVRETVINNIKKWKAEKGDKLRDIDAKINNILKRVHPEQELDFNIITTPIDERGRGVEIILKRTIN